MAFSRAGRTLALGGTLFGAAVLLAGAALLWARQGPSVFLDTLAAGFAACL